MTPKSEALAYRIWAYCNPRGWNCTFREVADELDVTPQFIGIICFAKGWHTRLRSSEYKTSPTWGYAFDPDVSWSDGLIDADE